MRVSVILPTARYGGMDMLHHCIANQTMAHEDFEIIVVDELYHKRPDALKLHNLNIKHIPPDRKSEVYNNTACFNAALRRVEGELVLFMIDFMWVYPRYLDDHWAYYKANPGWSMTGFVDRYEFPPLDLGADNDNSYRIFKDVFDARFAERWFKKNEPVYRERKGGAGIIHPDGMVEMLGRAKICLNFSDGGQGKHYKGRVAEALLSGCLLMEWENDETSSILTPFKEYVTFSGPQDLVNKVSYYLGAHKERERIAHAGRMAALEKLDGKLFWNLLFERLGLRV